MKFIDSHFNVASGALKEFSTEENFDRITRAAELCIDALNKGNKIISCGNGGSMCDAMHLAEELTGRYRGERAAIPAVAISDPSFLSCVANDFGWEYVFSRFIEGMGKEGDVLFVISTSGNSKNIINAAKAAKEKNMVIIGLTGQEGGEVAALCDIEIRAPYSEHSDLAQEIHIKVIHSIVQYIEKHIFNVS